MAEVPYVKAKYYNYEEMTVLLQQWSEQFSSLLKVDSLGKSLEGREIWYAEVTQTKTGRGEEKPGFYIDSNLHAGEVTGSAVTLYTLHYLLTNYGKEELVTHLLDTRVFYIVPRISVDGAEVYLNTPQTIRSSTKIRPFFEEEEGIIPEDLTGNGVITMMRVKSEFGEWKKYPEDPRIMLRREPGDIKGEFYHLLPEGRIKEYEEDQPIDLAKSKYYLDINRNFPADWEPTEVAGDFPLSEPETRALAEFVVERKNITGVISYHTAGGIILRSSAIKKDDQMNQADLNTLKALAKCGELLTGYPSTGVFEGFNYQIPPKPLPGSFLEWNYEHLGLYSFTTELWDMAKSAGITKKKNEFGRYWLDVSLEDQLKIFEWNDKKLGGEGFKDWVTYEHPQLGEMEIGGWDLKYTRQNPPLKFLKDELHGNMLFSLEHAAASPHLQITDTKVKALGEDLYKIVVTVQNAGYLPTYLSEKAKERNQVREVQVEVDGIGLELIEGKAVQTIGHLDGFGKQPEFSFILTPNVQSKKVVSWVVRKKADVDVVQIKATSTKAGVVRKSISLK